MPRNNTAETLASGGLACLITVVMWTLGLLLSVGLPVVLIVWILRWMGVL